MPFRITGAAFATAAAMAAAALIVPAASSAKSGGRTVVVREKVRSVTIVHHSRATKGQALATGDRVLTRQGMFAKSGRSLGTLYTDCTNVGPTAAVFTATLQCAATYRFAKGQLSAMGVLTLGTGAGSLTILGGTGLCLGARGSITSGRPVKGYDTVDLLHLR